MSNLMEEGKVCPCATFRREMSVLSGACAISDRNAKRLRSTHELSIGRRQRTVKR